MKLLITRNLIGCNRNIIQNMLTEQSMEENRETITETKKTKVDMYGIRIPLLKRELAVDCRLHQITTTSINFETKIYHSCLSVTSIHFIAM